MISAIVPPVAEPMRDPTVSRTASSAPSSLPPAACSTTSTSRSAIWSLIPVSSRVASENTASSVGAMERTMK